MEDAFEKSAVNGGGDVPGRGSSPVREEAVQALVALGYSPTEALKAVQGADIGDDEAVEDALKKAEKMKEKA